jgi:hypothetical protein
VIAAAVTGLTLQIARATGELNIVPDIVEPALRI